MRGNREELITVTPEKFTYPLFLRRGGDDIRCFTQIYLNKEYDFLQSNPGKILDLGGYIGISSSYFTSKYPDVNIYVVEPDYDNYLLCMLNNRMNKNVKIINAAVWSKSVNLVEDTRHFGDMSIQYKEVNLKNEVDNSIIAYSVIDLMKMAAFERIDFLKIDIEGAEKEIFSSKSSQEWIVSCDVISCELHDGKVEGGGCTEAVESALSKQNFDKCKSGEYTYYIRRVN